MRQECLDVVYQLAKQDPRIFFIGSDLGFGTLTQFKEEIPDRFLMEGVNEANIIGMAAGLALAGKIVYVNTIATFLSRRCFEQIVLDLCLHDVKVRLIANGGGVVYAPLGPTHLAVEDIAILRPLPNMTIVVPCDADEMIRLMNQSVDWPILFISVWLKVIRRSLVKKSMALRLVKRFYCENQVQVYL